MVGADLIGTPGTLASGIVGNRAALADKGVYQPTDHADNQCTENRRPETMNVETINQPRCHFQHQGIDDESEETKG